MKLVQKHLIKFNHKNYSVIDKLGFLSKNLYNCAVYLNRQVFFSHQPFLTMTELHHALKMSPDYQALPAKVSQLVLKKPLNPTKKRKNNTKNRQINLQESLSCQDTKTRKKVETF